MSAAFQLRGHCPDCGRQHAVVRDLMAKHGYDVKHHYFRGVCQGQFYSPIEQSRERADAVVAGCLCTAEGHDTRAAMYRSGELQPATVTGPWNAAKREYSEIPFDQADGYAQRKAVGLAVQAEESRASMLRSFAKSHAALIARVHGRPLEEVRRPEPPPAILAGEKRQAPRGVLTARWVAGGGRVEWVDARGFRGKTTTRAWRAFPIVTTAEEN